MFVFFFRVHFDHLAAQLTVFSRYIETDIVVQTQAKVGILETAIKIIFIFSVGLIWIQMNFSLFLQRLICTQSQVEKWKSFK